MIIFLYGPDDFRRSQKKRDLIAEFKKKHSNLGLGTFDFEKKDAAEGLKEFARNQSIFETAKLAILENAFEEVEAKQLAKILQPFLETKLVTLLLSERDKPVKALAFLIEKPAIFQKFENLEGAAWEQLIATEGKRLGVSLAADAVRFLAGVYQGNTWALVTELQKLSTMKVAPGVAAAAILTKRDLDQFDLEAAPNYWGLLTGVKSADMRSRLFALEKLLALNDPPAKLFNILASQWTQKMAQFAEYDFAVKSGKLEYEEALVEAVLS